jgi:uncharacterized protein YfaS (alpha-2-macroglobulin family)
MSSVLAVCGSIIGGDALAAPATNKKSQQDRPDENWKILNVSPVEGSQGYFLQVRCRDFANEQRPNRQPSTVTNDESSGDETHDSEVDDDSGDYYGRGASLSRCGLSEDDLRRVTITPKIKFSVSEDKSRGFRIIGPFRKGSYKIQIAKGALSNSGAKLSEDFNWTFEVPARTPKVNFASNGRYLTERNWKSLPLTFVNVDEILVELFHVPIENVNHWLSREGERVDEKTGNLVARKNVRLSTAEDENGTTFLDLRSLVAKPDKGIYEVRVKPLNKSSEEVYGTGDARRLLVTNLNLIAKKQPRDDSYFISAVNAESGEPVRGVVIKSVTPSGRVIGTCKTSKSGCQLPSKDKASLDQAEATALLASDGSDFTYLRFSDLKLDRSDGDVLGPSYQSAEAAYSVALYGDRNIYRPNETVRLVGLLRDSNQLAPESGMPVVMNVRDSRRRLIKNAALKTNPAGLVELSLPLNGAGDTGEYSVELLVAGNVIGKTQFHVEEFVPERLRVSGGFKKENYISTDAAQMDFTAEYLFGGKAGGADFELTCELEQALFLPAKNADYSYAVWKPDSEERRKIPLGMNSGRLSSEGKGKSQCLAPKAHARFAGMTRLIGKVSVSEAGSGRTTQKVFLASVHPDSFYLGLKPEAKKLAMGDKTNVRGIVVGVDGSELAQDREIDVSVYTMKAEHNWNYHSETGEYRYNRTLHPELDVKLKVKAVRGRFDIPFTAQRIAPAYLVRAQSGNARTEVQIDGSGSGYAWDFWESGRNRTPGPMKATWLNLEAPAEIKLGQKSKVKVHLPYRGWVLMTTESDKVLSSEWIEAKEAGAIEWDFSVSEFQPNVYVSALLIKDPYLESKQSFLPERAFGVKSVKITPEEYAAKLTLNAPKTVLPKSKLSVKVSLSGGDAESFVTLAAVDEGILQLTGYPTPDPLAELQRKRALGVDTFETVGWNFQLASQPNTSKTGGDGSGRGVGAGLPRPVKPVALWSGVIRLNKNGTATVNFDVPSFRGELRLMAVAAGKKRIASAESRVTVSEPIVIQPTTPRFLAMGDQAEIPVFLSNTTAEAKKVEVSIKAETFDTGDGAQAFAGVQSLSSLSVVGDKLQTINVAPMKSAVAIFRIKANQPFGGGKLTFSAVSGEISVSDEAEIPLLPPQPETRTETVSKISAGKQNLSLAASGLLSGSDKSTVMITANPFAPVIAGHIESLVHYPYGCIEQTTSSTRPILYLPQLISDYDPSLGEPEKIRKYVQAGVQRVLSMQLPSGGFAYWPGISESDPFGSLAAVDLLQEAQKLGYEVPTERINLAVTYLDSMMTNELMNRAPNSGFQRSWYGWDIEPYLHYLLARAGKPQKARVEKLLEFQREMNFESSYLLKAALYLAGDRRYEVDLRAPSVPRLTEASRQAWGYYSELRSMGLILSVQNELFPSTDSAVALAFAVVDRMASRRSQKWGLSTQELGWAMTGLGKMMRAKPLKNSEAKLYLDGKLQNRVASAGENEFFWRMRGAVGRPLQLDLRGKDGMEDVFAFVRTEGISQNSQSVYASQGLSAGLRLLNMKGEPLDLTKPMRLGEIVVAQITLEAKEVGEDIRNVAVTYRFPSGLEIENPRLGRGKTLGWLDQESLWKTDFIDIRDSRISFFGTLERGKKVVMAAALRATLSGKFSGGFVDANAMYDARVFSKIPAVDLTINREK